MSDDPELALGMEDDGDRFEECGSDGPAAAEEFDGMVGRAAASEVEGEVQIAERGGRRGRKLGAVFLESELPGFGGDKAGGAAGFVGVVPAICSASRALEGAKSGMPAALK